MAYCRQKEIKIIINKRESHISQQDFNSRTVVQSNFGHVNTSKKEEYSFF
jgi:hypothetical protein